MKDNTHLPFLPSVGLLNISSIFTQKSEQTHTLENPQALHKKVSLYQEGTYIEDFPFLHILIQTK